MYSSKPDNELAELLKSDDKRAFTELYSRYWDKLFAVAFHRLANEQEAEEVVQEVFLSLWKRRCSIHLRYTLITYLSVSVKYQIINRLAKQYRVETFRKIYTDDQNGVNYTDLWLYEKELQAKLNACVDRLPEKCKLVFQKSRNEGKSIKQIAEDLKIAEKTVESHITKALSALKNALLSILLL